MKWMPFYHLLIVILLFSLLISCGLNPDSPLPVSPLNPIPYFTQTSTYQSPTPTLPPTETPAPTPTPNLYSIAAGDTLSKVAQRFGISLEALLAANPGVEPAQLSVGQTITIPSSSQPPVSVPLFTPIPAELGQVACYSSNGGLSCLAPVHNSNPDALENVKVQITIFGADGRPIGSQEAALPLDILQPGQTLPVDAYFPGISTAPYALSQLTASTTVAAADKRYIPALVQNLLVSIDWNGKSAQLTGQVGSSEGSQQAGAIWLVAVAYDTADQIVGFRRWDWKGAMQAGEFQPFSLKVYSEGPAIDHVDVQVEARP